MFIFIFDKIHQGNIFIFFVKTFFIDHFLICSSKYEI